MQAKEIRKTTHQDSFPIIVMDKFLSQQAHKMDNFKNNMKSNQIKGTVKDIIDYNLTSWEFCKSHT